MLAKAQELIKGRPGWHVECSLSRIFIAGKVDATSNIQEIIRSMECSLTVLVDHGKDADLLAKLLERHPELENHPGLSRVIGAFDNLDRVVREVKEDKTIPTKLEQERRQRGHITINASDLRKEPERETVMTAEARLEHRRRGLLGLNMDQLSASKKPPDQDQLPPSYERLREGNVFTEDVQSKGADKPEAEGDKAQQQPNPGIDSMPGNAAR
jgi:hypothetical protein